MSNRVLIVDDHQDAAEMLGLALQHLGYDVRTATDGRGGLEVTHDFHPDAALLDVGLPDISGYEHGGRYGS